MWVSSWVRAISDPSVLHHHAWCESHLGKSIDHLGAPGLAMGTPRGGPANDTARHLYTDQFRPSRLLVFASPARKPYPGAEQYSYHPCVHRRRMASREGLVHAQSRLMGPQAWYTAICLRSQHEGGGLCDSVQPSQDERV